MTTAAGYIDLKFGHLSTLVFQGRQKQYADLDRLFGRGYDVVTVTEIGSDRRAFRRLAKEHGYRAHTAVGSDGGVAIKRALIVGGWRNGIVRVIRQSGRALGSTRPFGPKGIVWAGAELVDVGSVDVGTVHYLTGGRVPGKRSQHGKVNHYLLNVLYASKIGAWGRQHGQGKRLAFITGDFNIPDRLFDVFLGRADFTTCWDEIHAWPAPATATSTRSPPATPTLASSASQPAPTPTNNCTSAPIIS